MPIANNVLIVEDHPIFRKGLSELVASQPGFTVVGEAENRSQAMDLLLQAKPDLVLVDLSLGNENGLDLIKDMRSLVADVLILVLSMHDERFYAERALHAGARGYIMKQEASTKVIEAIRTVLSGKVWLSQNARERMIEHMAGTPGNLHNVDWLASINKLSDREFEIFALIGKGLGTAEIATRLNLSVKTIDTHKEHIKSKLHCSSSHDLRQFAIEWQTNQARP